MAHESQHTHVRVAYRCRVQLPGRRVEAVADRGLLALLDEHFGFGQPIATQAMDIAAKKAAQSGFAAVALRTRLARFFLSGGKRIRALDPL